MTDSGSQSQSFVPICAIGASAGGVEALKQLFQLLPADLGMAYVVIIHLAPDHPSALDEILGSCTTMMVHQVQDSPTLYPNQVYCIPPDRELVIEGNEVRARPFTEPRGQRAPIDMFFRSVASGRGDGIAIVLSGGGSDGTFGIRAVKEAGGVIMVQDPHEAGFPVMPQNAIATGLADFVAPLARLAEHVVDVARSKEAVRSLDADIAANDLRRIIAFLRTRTGHDFSNYKRATILRRVTRRMQVCGQTDLVAYANHLRDTPEEAKALFGDLLISVTMFFRDQDAFSALAQRAVRPLVEGAGEEGLRVWVVGCATGEEAYGTLILLIEEADRQKRHLPIQVFATDLDERALLTAREGRYPRTIEADVSEERLRRFFFDEGTHYRIRQEVRDRILFATHSVLREPPFTRLDLITCRNVLIYLERSVQEQVCTIFHYGLKPERYLFLGSAETVDTALGLFATLDRDARIYLSRSQTTLSLPVLSATAAPRRSYAPMDHGPARADASALFGKIHTAALETSAPPSALVDDAHAVLHLSPQAGRFTQLQAGPLSASLPTIVRPELRLELKLALDRVFERGQPMATHPINVRFEGETRRVGLHIAPVPTAEGAGARALVCFLDHGLVEPSEEAALEGARPDELRRLHAELKAAQEGALASRLQHEAAVEDLSAANEELQSLNEEYRSTAEELETSKEELQSINEELQTVNAELKSKLAIVSTAHNDLINLTASSEIGTLFLDSDLRIRMFTPRVADLINVAEPDIGRPVTNFTHSLDYPDWERDVRQVLRDLAPFEREVRDLAGRWFLVRLRPYRTIDGVVDGAVVTFNDITTRKNAEIVVQESERRLSALAQAASEVHYRMSPDWSVLLRLSGGGILADATGPGRTWTADYLPEDEHARFAEATLAAMRGKDTFTLEHRARRIDGTVVWLSSRAVPLLDAAGEIVEWFGAASDITARRRTEQAMRSSEERQNVLIAELQHRSRNLIAVITAVADRTLRRGGSVSAFEERLQALSRAQGLLSQFGSDTVEVGALVRMELAAHADPESERVKLAGPEVHLTARQVQNFALALHELATNAVKYGALRAGAGHLVVAWKVIEDRRGRPRLALSWIESGVTIEPGAIERRGYGTELIREALSYALRAEVEHTFGPDGVRCRIEMPITQHE